MQQPAISIDFHLVHWWFPKYDESNHESQNIINQIKSKFSIARKNPKLLVSMPTPPNSKSAAGSIRSRPCFFASRAKMNQGLVRPHRSKAIVRCPSLYSSQVMECLRSCKTAATKSPSRDFDLASRNDDRGRERAAKKGRHNELCLLLAQEIRNLDLN